MDVGQASDGFFGQMSFDLMACREKERLADG
jgi:hypothetical protein